MNFQRGRNFIQGKDPELSGLQKVTGAQFFHHKASQRKKKNTIVGLRDEDGQWQEEEEKFKRIIIWTTSWKLRRDESLRSEEMNKRLLQEFRTEKVYTVLHLMHPLKSLGPNGMPVFSYQQYWHIVGQDVITAVLHTLNTSQILPAIKYTHVVLIPKIK